MLVIGGGINGVAIARRCARDGKSTLVVEQHDFASGTTSRSTRIIHGGLRYLEHSELHLVRESLRERDRLLSQSPHLVRPLQFLLALPAEALSFRRSALAVRTGLWLYHRWAGRQWREAESTHESDRHAEREFERQLDGGNSWAVYSYEDAQCEFPERLVAEWLREAVEAGATALNYTQVLQLRRRDGRVSGALLRDTLSAEEFDVSADHIVNATGPWADAVAGLAGVQAARMVGGVRGSHLVLPHFPGAPEQAIFTEALDRRPIFVIPWNHQTLVGTTEVEDSGNPAEACPSAGEIDYLMRSFLRLFPLSGLTRFDIRFSFAGVRPLPFSPGKNASDVTRKHIIHDHEQDGAPGLLSIIGGKLTTAAALAREVARAVGIHSPEPSRIIAGPAPAEVVESIFKHWAHLMGSKAHIPELSAEAIAAWHGRHAQAIATAAAQDESLRAPLCSHTSHIVAEAVEAVSREHAVTLGDILLRRVPVALSECWDHGCSREAAANIGGALGWNAFRIGRELERFEEERQKFLHPKGIGNCQNQVIG